MRSNKEIAAEALRRAAENRRLNGEKKQRVYILSSIAACLAVIIGLSFCLPSVAGVVSETPSAASATLLAGAGTGGYVLMGIIGFALGAAVTLFCVKTRKKD